MPRYTGEVPEREPFVIDVPAVALNSHWLEMPAMLLWLVATLGVMASAVLWWRRDKRLAAVILLGWGALSVAAGYEFLGPVPSAEGFQ